MRACLYARKSTAEEGKHERERSCEQQLAMATEFCQRRGWPVVATYRDDGISGAEFLRRPGFKALRDALEGTPRPFDVVVVMEFSRLGRDTTRSLAALLEIEEAGAQVWSYLDGERISLESESDEMRAVFKAMGASSERRKVSERTYEAMRLRFQAGAQLGLAPYGYSIHRNGGPYAGLLIEPTEAQRVRGVFRWYDEGAGLSTIVRRLNAAGVPAPRGGKKGWTIATVGIMLRRPTYAGRRIWNREKRLMRRGTKDRQQRAANEWLTVESPELAIVEREVFDRVQQRIAEREAYFMRTHTGRLIGRPRGGDDEAVYLLSSLLVCTRCGGTLVGMRGSRSNPGYRCSTYHRRGVSKCGNGLRALVKAMDAAVIDAVAKALEPETVAEAIKGAVVSLTASHAEAATKRSAITAELATIATRERKLLDAIMDGDGAVAESIKARLREELARRDALAAQLAKLETAPEVDVESVTRAVQERAQDLAGLLRRHPAQARQAPRYVLAGARFQAEPFHDHRGKGYRVTATGSYARLGIKGLEPFTLRNTGHAPRNHPDDGGRSAWRRRTSGCRVR